VFTTIPGVDAGKLRAAFSAAFSDEPSERPSTGTEFVAGFQDAFSTREGIDEPAKSVAAAAVPVVSDTREDPPLAPASDVKKRAEDEPADDVATLDLPFLPERVVAEERARQPETLASQPEKPAMSEEFFRESQEPEPRERKPESQVARPAPIDESALFADLAPLRARVIGESYRVPVQTGSGSRVLVGVAIAVAVSFAAGFGGGFLVGQRSRPSTEPTVVSRSEPVPHPQPARAPVEDPKPAAAAPVPVAPTPTEKATTSEPIAATEARPAAVATVASGRLLVRSTPAGAGVMVNGQSHGVTPLTLRDLAFGTHTIEVSHPGHTTRRQRVTLSERRPARSVDLELRPTSVATPAEVATTTGSLQVLSRPAGAQVFVDDALIGTTPLLLSNVAAGSRGLRVELSGYKVWTTAVRIEPGARARVSASLEP
jgi:hypothetical protein